ncbi:MAG: hypothetical protein KDE00_13715 [Rhodobacteraceae bacterium]|nr:hypothetical protein [Paracoccaceae bacterium]
MLRALAWCLGMAFAAAIVAFGIGIALPEVIAISQREGAYMMAVAFVYTPAAFIAAAVVGLVVWNARRKPSEKQAALHADADMR